MQRLWNHAWPAAVVLIPGLLGTGTSGRDELGWSRDPDAGLYALIVVAALAATQLQRRPVVTFACCGPAVVAGLLAGYPIGPFIIAVPIAAAGVAAAWPLRRALSWNTALWLAVFAAGGVRFGPTESAGPLLGWLAGSFAAVAVPTAIGAALLRVRAAEARRAVLEERLRMAHELHDSVGHGLAVIAMQAGVALHVLDRNPAKARESLEAIRAASRESLDGLRAELDVLRTPPAALPPAPQPGLAAVGTLLDRIRGGGVEVVADLHDGDLPPDVATAVYRILQESLTNVLRHAGATAATVQVRRDGEELLIDVTDNGSAATTATRHGTGIAGMRSRAETLGGSLEAGPRPEGGFALRARLPLAGPA